MAQAKAKKKVVAPTKRPASKSAPKKIAAKPKAAAKKPAAVKKPAAAAKKAAVKAKPKAKALAKTPPPKPVAKAKPAAPQKKAAPTKPAAKTAPVAVVAAPTSKRPVAVSHRPQAAAVAVQQSRPTKPAPATSKSRQSDRVEIPAPGMTLTEDQVRRAPDSAYMNENQLAFFQERLLQMRAEVLTRELDVKERLHQREVFADPADRASAEEEHWLDLRLRERESLLLKKIDDALRRIRDREYGYCEKTGEAIGIARLLARPTATVCVDIKGQDERAESQYRDR